MMFAAAHLCAVQCPDGLSWLWLGWPPAPAQPEDDALLYHICCTTASSGARLTRYGRRWMSYMEEQWSYVLSRVRS